MTDLYVIIGAIVTILIFLYTVGLGIWTLKKFSNRTGAIAIFFLALAVLILPVIVYYTRNA